MNQHDYRFWVIATVFCSFLWGLITFFPTKEEKEDARFRVLKIILFMFMVISGGMVLMGHIGGVKVIPIPVGDPGGD